MDLEPRPNHNSQESTHTPRGAPRAPQPGEGQRAPRPANVRIGTGRDYVRPSLTPPHGRGVPTPSAALPSVRERRIGVKLHNVVAEAKHGVEVCVTPTAPPHGKMRPRDDNEQEVRHGLGEHLRVVDEWGFGRHPQPERREDLDVKNAASVVRGAVGVPAQRVRHADLVEIAQALRDEDD